jgi:hypothetical protein
MTGELKSMFESHLDQSVSIMSDQIEKQRIELEDKKKKDYIKKQSK